MKRTTVYIVLALAAALAMGAMAGCGNQSASSSSAADSGSATAEQTQEEIIAEFKDIIANKPTYKSVTVNELVKASYEAEDANEEDGTIEAATVYQFDASGDKLKTSMTGEVDGITVKYFSVGDDAVFVSDGPVYSGTTEQFDLSHFGGVEEYLTESLGDLNTIVECVDTAAKEQEGDVTVYTLTIDPEKFMAADEILTMLKEDGDAIVSEVYTFGVDQEGRIVSATEAREFEKKHRSDVEITLSEFDSTVIDPMPEADKTYEDLEADEAAKYETLIKEIEGDEALESAVNSESKDK